MRRRLIELDLLECVLGLGPNLFYNSSMEACILVCRMRKPVDRRGKVILIDALHEVTRERTQSFLTSEHQQRILGAYRAFADEPGFAKVARIEEVLERDGNLSISRYVRQVAASADSCGHGTLQTEWAAFDADGREFWEDMSALVNMVDGQVGEGVGDV